MPDFSWRAAQPDAQIVEGHLQAASAAQAMTQLRAQGLTPLFIGEGGSNVAAMGGAASATFKAPAPASRGLSQITNSAVPFCRNCCCSVVAYRAYNFSVSARCSSLFNAR